jgi:hypothetical protein
MARCPSCDYPLPEDRERLGARCPSCRDPLYEPIGRYGRPIRAGEAACAVHTGSESVGTCQRCGNYLCEVCRTPWQNQLLCAACVDRALQSREATPEQGRTHFRQALLGLCLGIATWVLGLLIFVGTVLIVAASGEMNVPLIALMMFLLVGNAGVALFGVGSAAAALRTRGNHMILATIGLILSGLYVGALVGMMTMSIWQS